MKKGFTLIELLAVIVILAIIALIATPIILGIINNAKNESDKRSVELYVKAAELAVARKNLTDEFKPTECKVKYGVCKCDGVEIQVDVDNASNLSGKIIFNEKGVVISNTLSTEPPVPPKANGEVVYFNVKDGVKCSESDYNEDNSKTGYNGLLDRKTTDNQNSCLKFYAFNDNEDSEILNLLLDHNTTAGVAWNSSRSNSSGPNEVIEQLATDTSGWNTPTPISYISPLKGYTVNYTKARLITAQEIAQITGNTGWKETSPNFDAWFYFDTLNRIEPTERNYGWLYDRTFVCRAYGCLHGSDQEPVGYWTVSASAYSDSQAWHVEYQGFVTNYNYGIDNGAAMGVRPVIEVSKSSLK